ncbi:MAG: hypothetical protein QOE11_119 [Solirubrobacteraceae bacterium]|jgi:hypothetical protein|nr:hypothetical protein [Solirubrobacteraceae bacterium]
MLRSLFARHEDSQTLLQSPESTSSSRAPAEQYATLGPISALQFGRGASPIVASPGVLSPVIQARAERIMSNPCA